MKKGNLICFVSLCFGLSLFSPYVSCRVASAQNQSSHIDTCLECHEADDLHMIVGHESCEQCHLVRGGANVKPDKCVVCHPVGNPGTCNLAVDHGSTCIECHTECVGGGTTTTTVSPSAGHIDMCLGCHGIDYLHAIGSHAPCAQCHTGGEVGVNACAVCHPVGNPGTCSLAVDHGSACMECHTECGGGEATTTTVSPSAGHIDMCLDCHGVDYLHAIGSHNTCTQCHSGGDVGVNACAVCHPLGNPGTCNLADDHGSACIGCHNECGGSGTTTTSSPPDEHIAMCTPCHMADTLHAIPAHLTCAHCHDDREVRVGKCIMCHPTDGPGTCNLAYRHGTACLACHVGCTGNTTTTAATSTTTTIDDYSPVVEKVITTYPKEFFRSQFMPFPLMMLIAGAETNFNQTSKVSFDNDSLFPPIRFVLSRKSIFVFSILRPIGLFSTSDREVIVSVRSTVESAESEMYEEVGSCSFYLVPLPF